MSNVQIDIESHKIMTADVEELSADIQKIVAQDNIQGEQKATALLA